jgi:hypothetical protein
VQIGAEQLADAADLIVAAAARRLTNVSVVSQCTECPN